MKGNSDAVAVARPEVLGDGYDELVMNLDLIAHANLAVVIVPREGDRFVRVETDGS